MFVEGHQSSTCMSARHTRRSMGPCMGSRGKSPAGDQGEKPRKLPVVCKI